MITYVPSVVGSQSTQRLTSRLRHPSFKLSSIHHDSPAKVKKVHRRLLSFGLVWSVAAVGELPHLELVACWPVRTGVWDDPDERRDA